MSPLVLAPLIVAVVLAVSGIAKVRQPEDVASAFSALRLPRWLGRPFFRLALPWAELALAVALLVLPGVAGVIVAMAALALMLAYTVVIGRALTFGYPVDCNCFGRLGLGEVTRRTLARNVLLTLVAGVGVAYAVVVGRMPLGYVVTGGPGVWGWVLGAGVAALVATLIVGGRPTPMPGPVAGEPAEVARDGGELDYVRHPTPPAAVITATGVTYSVRELARTQAQLLVFTSPSCGSCKPVSERMGQMREKLGPVALREVYTMEVERGLELEEKGDIAPIEHALFDPHRMLRTALEIGGTPAAVLLGTDDLLAGGPVVGTSSVLEFIEDVAAEVAAALPPEGEQAQAGDEPQNQ